MNKTASTENLKKENLNFVRNILTAIHTDYNFYHHLKFISNCIVPNTIKYYPALDNLLYRGDLYIDEYDAYQLVNISKTDQELKKIFEDLCRDSRNLEAISDEGSKIKCRNSRTKLDFIFEISDYFHDTNPEERRCFRKVFLKFF